MIIKIDDFILYSLDSPLFFPVLWALLSVFNSHPISFTKPFTVTSFLKGDLCNWLFNRFIAFPKPWGVLNPFFFCYWCNFQNFFCFGFGSPCMNFWSIFLSKVLSTSSDIDTHSCLWRSDILLVSFFWNSGSLFALFWWRYFVLSADVVFRIIPVN